MAYPTALLNAYALAADRHRSIALSTSVIRSRSLDARRLIAHAAAGKAFSLEDLLAAARGDEAGRAKLKPRDLNSDAFFDLARVLAVQNILSSDQTDALFLADLGIDLFGARHTPPRQQGLHAQLAYHHSQFQRTRQLLDAYKRVPQSIRDALELDLLNPFVAGPYADHDAWIRRLCGFLPGEGVAIAERGKFPPFDGLTGFAGYGVDSEQLISVIVTSYKPDHGLITAVKSLAQQTWRNLEIVVIDDGSPPEHDAWLQLAADTDPRVQVKKLEVNLGTYGARNAGLHTATGSLITFLDSDDWSHPQRLEHQAAALAEDPELVAVQSDLLNITDQLTVTQPGHRPLFSNASSLMFRRQAVIGRIGDFDDVRKAADNEYIRRMRAVFGTTAIRRLSGEVHILRRLAPESLSHSEFRGSWAHPARAAYWSGYHHWHERIRDGVADPRLPSVTKQRPFRAPDLYAQSRTSDASPVDYDVVYAGDWRLMDETQRHMLDAIAILIRRGVRVAILHIEAMWHFSIRKRALAEPIQRLLDQGAIDQLFAEERHRIKLLLLGDPAVLQFKPYESNRLEVQTFCIVADHVPSASCLDSYSFDPCVSIDCGREYFGVRPSWLPRCPAARHQLRASGVPDSDIRTSEYPSLVDSKRWCVPRDRFRSALPVIGYHRRNESAESSSDVSMCTSVYPKDERFDVRFLGGFRSSASVSVWVDPPSNWLIYGFEEVSIRNFLFQLDFWVHFPHPDQPVELSRSLLEALASGCVVILPVRYRPVVGDAAVYSDESHVQDAVAEYRGNLQEFIGQSLKGQEYIRTGYCEGGLVRLLSELLGEPSGEYGNLGARTRAVGDDHSLGIHEVKGVR